MQGSLLNHHLSLSLFLSLLSSLHMHARAHTHCKLMYWRHGSGNEKNPEEYILCQQSTTCHNNFPLCCGGRDQSKQFCSNDKKASLCNFGNLSSSFYVDDDMQQNMAAERTLPGAFTVLLCLSVYSCTYWSVFLRWQLQLKSPSGISTYSMR